MPYAFVEDMPASWEEYAALDAAIDVPGRAAFDFGDLALRQAVAGMAECFLFERIKSVLDGGE